MMQLATIASFVVLLCGLFGVITAANDDQNTTTCCDMASSTNDLSSSCIFGVQSVSLVLFTSDYPNGTPVPKYEFCGLFNNTNPVIFITHGFLATAYNYNFSDLASVLVRKGYTVFSVDWDDASCYNDPAVVNLLFYPAAVDNTPEVGNYMADCYIKTMIDKCGVPLKNITLMGHSLGAHISGFAAKKLKNSNYIIPLLIGTDPAAPEFMFRPCWGRFCVDDAERVVAFHTSALGLQKSIADLDLWFNNGLSQPACGGFITGSVNVNCSHNEVIKYLITLINNCEYIGVSISERDLLPGSGEDLLPGSGEDLLPGLTGGLILSLRKECGCHYNKTNSIDVNNKIFDSNSNITGNYCVFVSSKYPYCTKDYLNCQK